MFGRRSDGSGVSSTDWALLGYQRERLGDQVGPVAGDPRDRSPSLALHIGHPPAKQRMKLDRDQRRLVSPVFDQPTVDFPGAVTGDAIKARAIVRTEPGKHRHVMRPAEDADGIKLQDPEAAHESRDLVDARWAPWARSTEALSCERDPPCAAHLATGSGLTHR